METEDLETPSTESDTPPEPRPKAPPIESRFLYVDIAAMRAKQLRRGAVPRIDTDGLGEHRPIPHKAERIAMEEVRQCLVLYELPGSTTPPPAE
jgi:DNA-directed RNA polymerase subunit K/omega